MARHPLTLGLLLGSIVAALACAGAPCGEGTVKQDGKCVAESEADADTDADADSDTDADPGAPDILTFTTNVSTLTEGDDLVFTAVVTDPQGIDDLIGGTLVSEGGGTYGSFATASEEGSYSLTLTWSAINTVESIEFTDSEERTFIGRFYDQAGHASEKEVSVELSCGMTGYGACDGICEDLTSDTYNCGACHHECDADPGREPLCDAGACIHISDCIDDLSGTCEAACRAQGYSACNETAYGVAGAAEDVGDETCATAYDEYDYWNIETCDERMQVDPAADIASCVCVE